jgi:hypothetical protein
LGVLKVVVPLSPQAKTGSEMNRFFYGFFLKHIATIVLHRASLSFFVVDCVERVTQSGRFTFYSSHKPNRLVCLAVKHLLDK